MEKDLLGDLSGDFKHLMVALLQGARNEQSSGNAFSCEMVPMSSDVATDAKLLYESGEK
ncbi:unnamed protein product [Protopolystoma xenopodis]|uniref:Uncharacterized protein n=1 Tax=Protopolystoma xenopodis TaxID=117903 RepID=A0A3S5AKH2_9PLAT|nr:unnamed protein product [Protopolystoma xenopodis]